MKYLSSFPISELIGKTSNLGEKYFRTSGGIRIFQGGRNNSPSPTPALQFNQATFASSMAAWNGITDSQKESWNTWVTTERALDLDQNQQISGTNAYRAMWITATNGRHTPRVSAPSAVATGSLGAFNRYAFLSGPGRWFISVFADDPSEVNSYCLFETTTPDASEARPYRKEDLTCVGMLDLQGSVSKTTQTDRWSLWVDDPVREPVIGEWVWVRCTMWSPSWWPSEQRIYHVQTEPG